METLQDLITERDTLAQRLDDLNQQIEQLKGQGLIYGNGKTKTASSENPTGAFDFDTIYEFVRKRALQDPKLLQVLTTIPRIEVQEQIEPLTVDGNTLRGKIALLVKEGLIDEQPKGSKEFRDVLVKRGWNPKEAYANISNALEDMAKKGFVTREEGNTYLAVTDMKANIVKTR